MQARLDRWMSASRFADATGESPRTVREWCANGKLPAVRKGAKIWMVDLVRLKSSGDEFQQSLYVSAILGHKETFLAGIERADE